jgi:WD40 repeat protein
MKRITCTLGALALFSAGAGAAEQKAEKITFVDHVLPIFRNACLRCHNPDKAKGDLDISTFNALMAGGGSGMIVESGDPDASTLVKVVTHAEEPEMPPNGKLEDKEIDIIKKWIAGGLLESSGSKAIQSNKPKMDLSLTSAAFGKPDGPPPMPGRLLLDPAVTSEKATASTALAASPWAPVAAIGSQRQILLYNTDTYQLAGVLPFPEGYPADAKFSRNGKLLIVGGGRGAHTGLAVVWDITTGERILSVGEDLDAVLAADISADQKFIATGGPDKLVKLYSTATGELVNKMKKHTDWVTAAEFSPDAKYLATGDRSGGIVIWEASTGREVNVIASHKQQITSLNWRSAKLIAASSEDGFVKTFNATEGDEVKSTRTHSSGTLHAAINQNGWIVTCGRDKRIYTWDPNVARKASIAVDADLPVRVAFTYDAKKVIGADWKGNVFVWDATKGTKLAELDLNPPALAPQVTAATRRLAELEKARLVWDQKLAGIVKGLAASRTEMASLTGERDSMKTEMARLQEEMKTAQSRVKELESTVGSLNSRLSGIEPALEKAKQNIAALAKSEIEVKAGLIKAETEMKQAKSEAEALQLRQLVSRLYLARQELEAEKNEELAAKAKLEEVKSAQTRMSTGLTGVQKALAKKEEEKKALEAQLQKMSVEAKAAAEQMKQQQEAARKAAEELQKRQRMIQELEQQLKSREAGKVAGTPVAKADK